MRSTSRWIVCHLLLCGLLLVIQHSAAADEIEPKNDKVGEVFGKAVYRGELSEDVKGKNKLHELFLIPVLNHYKADHKKEIEPTKEELANATVVFDRQHKKLEKESEPRQRAKLKKVEDQLAKEGLSASERAELLKEKESWEAVLKLNKEPLVPQFASFMLTHWKFEKHLYDNFGGGRLLWQQGGVEAFDAMRKFLETREKAGDFKITDKDVRDKFYEYWTRQEKSAFLIEDPQLIKKEFLEPEWTRKPSAEATQSVEPKEWRGVVVMPKMACKLRIGDKEINDYDSDVGPPYTIEAKEDEWLVIEGKQNARVRFSDVVRLEEAVDYYTEQLQFGYSAYHDRGIARELTGDHDGAIADFDAALKDDPSSATYVWRATAWTSKREPDKAISDFGHAIKLSPSDPVPYVRRSMAYISKRLYEKAIADLNRALELSPTYDTHNAIAWILATCADAKYRDGQKAVEHAMRACELSQWKDAFCLDTLAAAYAEVGDFAKAVQHQQQAIDLRPDDAPFVNGGKGRLKMYQSQQPYRDRSAGD